MTLRMNSEASYYEVLGVSPTASKREIKRSFRQISKKFHHDNVVDYDKRKVLKLNEAIAVLENPGEREKYDRKMGFNQDQMSLAESLSVSESLQYKRKNKEIMLMSESAAQSRRVEEKVKTDRNGVRVRGGGLIITKARFGSARKYTDVTNPVQCLVQHRPDHQGGYIEIEENLDKRTLTGLACPPGIRESDILLDIEYMFNLTMHRVRVSNFGALRIPLWKHAERFVFGSPRDETVSRMRKDLGKTSHARAKAIMLTFTISCFLLYWWTERKEDTDKKLEPNLKYIK